MPLYQRMSVLKSSDNAETNGTHNDSDVNSVSFLMLLKMILELRKWVGTPGAWFDAFCLIKQWCAIELLETAVYGERVGVNRECGHGKSHDKRNHCVKLGFLMHL